MSSPGNAPQGIVELLLAYESPLFLSLFSLDFGPGGLHSSFFLFFYFISLFHFVSVFFVFVP